MPKRRRRNPLADHPSLLQASLIHPRPGQHPARSLARANIVVRSFDDGAPVARTSPPDPAMEAAGYGMGEYDVAAANPAFNAWAYEQTAALAPPTQDGEHGEVGECEPEPDSSPETTPGTAPAASPASPPAMRAAPAASDAAPEPLAALSRRPANRFTAREMSKLVEDDDFRADIDVILGNLGPSRQASASVPLKKTPARSQPESESRPMDIEEAAAAVNAEPPGEHAIFDKIAENMQFANAYELAPINLSRRFDSFDRQDRRSAPPARAAAPSAQMSPTAPPPTPTVPPPTPEPKVVRPRIQTVRPHTEAERNDLYGDPQQDPETWVAENLEEVVVPQLAGLPGISGGNVRFHKRGAQSLRDFFAALEAEGLISQVDVLRAGYTETPPHGDGSVSHMWGIAFDIDLALPGVPSRPDPLSGRQEAQDFARIANRHGFVMGLTGTDHPTGLHFELGRRL